jgi:hypothetical protein
MFPLPCNSKQVLVILAVVAFVVVVVAVVKFTRVFNPVFLHMLTQQLEGKL